MLQGSRIIFPSGNFDDRVEVNVSKFRWRLTARAVHLKIFDSLMSLSATSLAESNPRDPTMRHLPVEKIVTKHVRFQFGLDLSVASVLTQQAGKFVCSNFTCRKHCATYDRLKRILGQIKENWNIKAIDFSKSSKNDVNHLIRACAPKRGYCCLSCNAIHFFCVPIDRQSALRELLYTPQATFMNQKSQRAACKARLYVFGWINAKHCNRC